MVSVSDRHGKRVRGVGAADLYARKQSLDHRVDLRFFGAADSDHRLLHQARGIFADLEAAPGSREQDHAPGLAELQARLRIVVEKHFFNGRRGGPMGLDHFAERQIQPKQAIGERLLGIGSDLAVGEMAQPVAFGPDQAPTGASEARIEADDDQPSRSRTSSETS